MKEAEIRLSYYKQGDDLKTCLIISEDNVVNIPATIDRQIALLQSSILQLNEIKSVYMKLKPNNVRLDGDGHFIGISGPDYFINRLIKEEIAERDPFESDDEDDGKISDKKAQKMMDTLIRKTYTDQSEGSETEPDQEIGSEVIKNHLVYVKTG